MEIKIRVGILTISDKGSKGLRRDESGEIVAKILNEQGFILEKKEIIPDDIRLIVDKLIAWVDKDRLSLIVTSGGTGMSPSDVTPEAMKEVIDYDVPGMAEAMRAASLKKTPHAMLSRAIVGVRYARPYPLSGCTMNSGHACLIINVPGSPGGSRDNLLVVLPTLNHALLKLAGDTSDCAI
ncbi:MAG: MogA/MoaB family molybdenum cofactor biosynthesis protein [Deltaproteobacteria bacterium]|nr:MogA/MoaB family molybdenum cofactor biosynthesis protein [Deltaproteobacteria bacterium]